MRRRTFLASGLAWGAARTALAAPRPILDRAFIVVLDAGHGGSNGGCVGADHGVLEKRTTLAVSKRVMAQVRQAVPAAKVLMTRTRDEDVPLSERIAIANDARAHLFVSVHANASPNKDQRGFETFVLGVEASNREVSRTARRTGGAAGSGDGPRDDAAVMLRELSLRGNYRKAGLVAREIQGAMAARFPTRINRGVRQGAFDVLRGLEMPGVLTEIGFLDHPEEGPWLGQPEVLDAVAACICGGITRFYRAHAHLD